MDKDDKNETTRFLGDGVSFKAKLIGILEVSEARGDRMCQEALSDLKMAIRAAGEHKQRITINIAIDGLRLRDEKTGDSLYHHPVHKISFIAQDMTDSRAFGYIFGSPDTGHRFFGIKTDKAASQVVIAMRDLFQVVFALKKKEIELAKQHLDKNRMSTSPLFTENNNSASKITATSTQETSKPSTDGKSGTSNAETKSVPAVADLVDLELELNSLQQGLTQMERITPSDPFGSKDDPFGDSFTSYPKPILPPPPSSGRERSSRVSESSSIFSPKTPHTGISVESGPNDASLLNEATRDPHAPKEFTFSQEFQSDEHSSGDWFTPSAGNSLFEEPPLVPEQQSSKDQHEAKKKEILSQFDVFTDLDPLGIGNNDKQSTSRCTGKIKPYVDKKHFFQELKNPPKKVLNDLVSESQPQEPPLFAATFDQTNNFNVAGQDFATDPFQDDPFDVDPFAENEFMKQDPFETAEPSNEFKNSFVVTLSKSPKTSVLDKQMSLVSSATSAASRNVQFASKRNTFDVHFDGEKKSNKLAHLHENPSLDLSSESECAPEPPPRPLSNLTAIVKPPPLPPKKQPGDTNVKPPPRPPHTDDVLHYEYADHYETAPNSLEFVKNLDGVSPPLPVPARKSKFESDFVAAPERPKKSFGSSGSGTVTQQEDDYLTPVSFLQPKEHVARHAGPLLLPPPQKSNRNKHHVVPMTENSNKTVESKPTPSNSSTNQNDKQLDGLDITLSQLTLSGLNELAMKLHIPASQLSNMTLAQLTKYLSNFIKSEQSTRAAADREVSNASPTFQADFAANFNNLNITNTASCDTYDRYAVFRELMIQEEIKQTKIDTEPEEITENQESSTAVSETTEDDQTMNNLDVKSTNENEQVIVDKYAALREIVEKEIMQKQSDKELDMENENDKNENKLTNDYSDIDVKIENETNIMNTEKNLKDESEVNGSKDQIIEYGTSPNDKVNMKAASPVKLSPVKTVKSPVPVAVTDVIQNSARLNSGSLSDVISGSSPEIDNTGSTSEVVKKSTDATAESWAIFDQPNIVQEAASKEKQNVQSEEGVSPWSSDSKEFGNGSSPPEWRSRGDSGSGGDHHWPRRRPKQREQEGWWDTSAEPEAQYYPPNRRSTDSYDEDCYECYDRPRRRRQAWTQGTQATGGHSSSSRDVSPWEEEPRRRDHRDSNRQTWSSRHARQHTFERHRDRRHTDSWDEEDDYEYEEEHNNRCHWPERHISREPERDRHPSAVRDVENDRWPEEWSDERRHRRRRETDRERWCCPDWEQIELDKPPSRHGSGRWSNPDTTSKWRDRKHDDCYYGRDSQDSPDDHDEHAPHYLAATKRNWKRPSSASEMDRKTGEIKGRQPGQYYLGTGGSDGERERRYKVNRRSKSRDSQFSESTYGRHKIDANSNARSGTHRGKFQHHAKPQQFDGDFVQDELPVKKQSDVGVIKLDVVNKKMATMSRLKKKDGPKVDEVNASTFPRKGMQQRAQSLFENDFVPSETSDSPQTSGPRFASFDLDTSEADSPVIVGKHSKSSRQQQLQSGHVRRTFDTDATRTLPVTSRSTSNAKERRPSPRFRAAPKCSMFEDDFSPTTEKADDSNDIDEDNGIGSNGIPCIKEEESHANETDDTFVANNNPTTTVPSSSRKSRLAKGRYFASGQLRKSDSVNIFARENDPFDDEFFCGNRDAAFAVERKMPPRGAELKWSEEFDDFDAHDDGK